MWETSRAFISVTSAAARSRFTVPPVKRISDSVPRGDRKLRVTPRGGDSLPCRRCCFSGSGIRPVL